MPKMYYVMDIYSKNYFPDRWCVVLRVQFGW